MLVKLLINRQRGFTLLELMIVVTIIGVLSAVVLASLRASQEGGRNAARVSQIKEYIKAFELYRSDLGVYPTHPLSNPPLTSVMCLGTYSDNRCWNNGTGVTARPATIAALINSNYMKRIPAAETERFGVTGTTWYEGMTYRHQSNGRAYTIQYFMEGNNEPCELPGAAGSNVGDDTLCSFNYTP